MSPFRSEAQRRKFGELVKAGKMSQETFDEWNRETGDAKLPHRLHPKHPMTLGKHLPQNQKKKRR